MRAPGGVRACMPPERVSSGQAASALLPGDLREHAARRRGRVSAMRIPGGRGREAPYTMIIRRRKKREGDGPEGMHIAFASNSPSLDPDALYPRWWGIEISYKIPRQTRMRTPGRDEHVRIFCFVVSLMVHNAWTMVHNAWTMVHSDRGAGGSRRWRSGLSRCWSFTVSTASSRGCGLRASLPPRRRAHPYIWDVWIPPPAARVLPRLSYRCQGCAQGHIARGEDPASQAPPSLSAQAKRRNWPPAVSASHLKNCATVFAISMTPVASPTRTPTVSSHGRPSTVLREAARDFLREAARDFLRGTRRRGAFLARKVSFVLLGEVFERPGMSLKSL